ncbi:terminase large subunit [Flavobacterium sp.]|uniref:terminase large subunit n=1 Tax=Flavobacterium sp. TaxID=239 RepID=UPI0040342F87
MQEEAVESIGHTKAFTKIAELRKNLRILCGGTSASKTTSILQYLIHIAQKRELVISIVGKNLNKLRRGAYQGQYGFIDILKKMGLYDPKNHNLTNNIYMLGNSKFEFFGADDELGSRRDVLFVNEGTEIDFESFSQLHMRTNMLTLIDFNPKSEFWVHTELLGKVDCDFLTLTYKDNDFLNEKIVKEIESWEELGKSSEYYANKWKVYGLGKLGIQSGGIYKDWKEIDEVPEGAELIGSGLDFGWNPDPVAMVSLWRYEDKLIVDEVIYEGELFNKDLADKIRKSGANDAIIYCDSASPQNIAELRSYGINVLPVTKGAGSVLYGIGIVQENYFHVTSRSKNLIKELYQYVWKTDKNDKALSVPHGVDHACDALRYIFRMKFSKKTEKFSLKWRR